MNKDYPKLIARSAIDILILFISFAVSLNLLRLFRLKTETDYGIENLSSFSPEISYPVLLLIAGFTLILFGTIKWVRSKNANYFRLIVGSIILLSYLIGAVAPYFASFENNIDTFHHGEQLAPALAYEDGKVPYKDLFFLHGAGEDVITPWLSFKLFGQSIGSYYFTIGILQLVGTSLFIFLLHKLFKHDLEFLVVLLWFALGSYSAFYYVRDIPVWLSLLLVYSLILGKDSGRNHIKLGALGLLASISLFYSLDRGVFLSALLGVIYLSNLLFVRSKTGFTFSKSGFAKRLKTTWHAPAGYMLGFLGGVILLGGGALMSFIKTSLDVSRYQGSIFNYPYPLLDASTFFYWIPLIALTSLVLIFIRDFKNEKSHISNQFMLEIILLIFGILFFRAATGRPDAGHVAYGSMIILLLFFIVTFRRIRLVLAGGARRRPYIIAEYMPLFVMFLALLSPSIVNYYRIAQFNQAKLSETKTFLSAPRKSDSFWTNDRTEQASRRIIELAGPNGKLFVFSSEPLFYYTTKLPNPTNFSISWFADAQPLENALLRSLTANPPTVIVYESGQGFNDTPDYIAMQKRLPKVNGWILKNYHHADTIQGVKLYVRN